MLAVILAWLLVPQQSAMIIGRISAPDNVTISRPVRVVLLPSRYAGLWSSEVQQRLDSYWEQYKPEFAQRKELFLRIASLAQREALDFVVARMQRDGRLNTANLILQSASNGQFEFSNVPVGEYRIVATATIDTIDFVWSEPLEITIPETLLVQLKSRVP